MAGRRVARGERGAGGLDCDMMQGGAAGVLHWDPYRWWTKKQLLLVE